MDSIGSKTLGTGVGIGSICFFATMHSLLNSSSLFLERLSANPLSTPFTCLAKILTFSNRPLSTIILISTMQFLQDDVVKFIMSTILLLWQNRITLRFLNLCIHVKTAAVTAKSSRYSILGLHFAKNSADHNSCIQF